MNHVFLMQTKTCDTHFCTKKGWRWTKSVRRLHHIDILSEVISVFNSTNVKQCHLSVFMGAVFKSMEPIKELLCLWHFQVKGSHFAWLVLVSTRTMELYRSDAPLPSVGASLVKILSSIKNRSFPISSVRFLESAPPILQYYTGCYLVQSIQNHCYSFVSTLRASPVHQATANVTTLKRDSVNTNKGGRMNERSQLLETKTHPKQAVCWPHGAWNSISFGCHDVIT